MAHAFSFIIRPATTYSMNLQSDICIIGNGAIGKTAALGFAQAGLSVILVDAKTPGSATAILDNPPAGTERAWDLRVYALNPLAQQLLAGIKVWDALDAARVTAVDAMVVKGDGVKHPGSLAFDAYTARVGALAWIVEDDHLNNALDSALRFASNVQRISATAISMLADESSALVRLADGRCVKTALVVGADGAQSWVRSQANIDLDYRPYGQRAIVANFSTALPHHGVAYQWFTQAEGIVALLPLAGNRVSLVWSAPGALADTLMIESPEALAARVTLLCGKQLGELQPLAPGSMRSIPLALTRPHAITAPRVALIGDAAHAIHPLAGQGMNLGFGDAAALIRSVIERDANRDCGDARVLARFARLRKEPILLMALATDSLQRLFATDFEPVRIVRNVGMSLVDLLPGVKRRLIAHAMGTKT